MNNPKLRKRVAIYKRTKDVTAASFGKKIARAMLRLKSSHVYFIIQQAYGPPPYGAQDMSWEEAEEILRKVLQT